MSSVASTRRQSLARPHAPRIGSNAMIFVASRGRPRNRPATPGPKRSVARRVARDFHPQKGDVPGHKENAVPYSFSELLARAEVLARPQRSQEEMVIALATSSLTVCRGK